MKNFFNVGAFFAPLMIAVVVFVSCPQNPPPKKSIPDFSYASIDAQVNEAISTSPSFKENVSPSNFSFKVEETLPTGLLIDENSGTISGTVASPVEAKQYTVTATAKGTSPYTGSKETKISIRIKQTSQKTVSLAFSYATGQGTNIFESSSQDDVKTVVVAETVEARLPIYSSNPLILNDFSYSLQYDTSENGAEDDAEISFTLEAFDNRNTLKGSCVLPTKNGAASAGETEKAACSATTPTNGNDDATAGANGGAAAGANGATAADTIAPLTSLEVPNGGKLSLRISATKNSVPRKIKVVATLKDTVESKKYTDSSISMPLRVSPLKQIELSTLKNTTSTRHNGKVDREFEKTNSPLDESYREHFEFLLKSGEKLPLGLELDSDGVIFGTPKTAIFKIEKSQVDRSLSGSKSYSILARIKEKYRFLYLDSSKKIVDASATIIASKIQLYIAPLELPSIHITSSTHSLIGSELRSKTMNVASGTRFQLSPKTVPEGITFLVKQRFQPHTPPIELPDWIQSEATGKISGTIPNNFTKPVIITIIPSPIPKYIDKYRKPQPASDAVNIALVPSSFLHPTKNPTESIQLASFFSHLPDGFRFTSGGQKKGFSLKNNTITFRQTGDYDLSITATKNVPGASQKRATRTGRFEVRIAPVLSYYKDQQQCISVPVMKKLHFLPKLKLPVLRKDLNIQYLSSQDPEKSRPQSFLLSYSGEIVKKKYFEFSVKAGTLPEGLRFVKDKDAAPQATFGNVALQAGSIYGTPTKLKKNSTVTMLATPLPQYRNDFDSAEISMNICVNPAPLSFSYGVQDTITISALTSETTFSPTVFDKVEKGVQLSYRITDGVLPDGLTLDPQTGAIRGTPNNFVENAFPITIEAKVSGTSFFATSSKKVTVQVKATTGTIPLFSYLRNSLILKKNKSFKIGRDRKSYMDPSFKKEAGIATHFSYTIEPSLPNGLKFSDTGRISGTPTVKASKQEHTITAKVKPEYTSLYASDSASIIIEVTVIDD